MRYVCLVAVWSFLTCSPWWVSRHLLYYGSLEGKVLHWSRSRTILEAQSVKMGRWYDSAESRKHIWPFIRSFGLEASLDDLVRIPSVRENEGVDRLTSG